MLALPAQPGSGGQGGFFHHRGGGIDEDLDLAAILVNQPAPDPFQAFLDDIMVVAVLRVNADCAAIRHSQDVARVMVLRIGFSQHDDRTCLGPQRSGGVAAPMHAFAHPAHVAVLSLGHELRQPVGNFRYRIWATDACLCEPPLCQSLVDDCGFDLGGQKSRSA